MGVGDVSISLGTSGVAAAISPVPAYDMTASVTGSPTAPVTGYRWPARSTARASPMPDALRSAWTMTSWPNWPPPREPGAGGITLVPYFDGERTPNRPDATAALYGMTLANTKRENIARAFVEGLLCSQRDCLELVRGLGVDVKRILLIGGGAKSAAVRALAPRHPRHGRGAAGDRRVCGDRCRPSGRLGAVRAKRSRRRGRSRSRPR